jgi:prevent-host-death family protein
MKTKVNTHEAKTTFSKLLRRVAAGEEIAIANRGVVVARLVPVEPVDTQRKLGIYKGSIWIANDFDAPLPEEIQAGFEGRKPRKKGKR